MEVIVQRICCTEIMVLICGTGIAIQLSRSGDQGENLKYFNINKKKRNLLKFGESTVCGSPWALVESTFDTDITIQLYIA